MAVHAFTSAHFVQIHEHLIEIPKSFRQDMRVPARIFTNTALLSEILKDRSLLQIVNVATLPGIQKYAFAMPDIHEGYGFPIGGVAATALDDNGVISPGGIGYDINCGVRLLRTSLPYEHIKPYIKELTQEIFKRVPSGLGHGGSLKLDSEQLHNILYKGVLHALEMGFGNEDDRYFCEEQGCLPLADATLVSDKAQQRGHDQLGTLGSGNHFLEIQVVDTIYDTAKAAVLGLYPDTVTIMIHCGSRGLGHQVCTDYIRLMLPKLSHWSITLPDPELACAPFNSPEGQQYFSAMAAAANFAWANRHIIGDNIRQAFIHVFGTDATVTTVYDISHNIGKHERHTIDNRELDLIVHRKGATRSFGPGRPELPDQYQDIGQPVLIPGTMGTFSYVLAGTATSMDASFGSSCHGAGRIMSRHQAKKTIDYALLDNQLKNQGILIKCDSKAGLVEEAPSAYKDVNNVVQIVHEAGLAHKVARLRPLAVIKGG